MVVYTSLAWIVVFAILTFPLAFAQRANEMPANYSTAATRARTPLTLGWTSGFV
jgi:hypothetical protein